MNVSQKNYDLPEQSSRLRLRCGNLARIGREDADGALARREPEELLVPLFPNWEDDSITDGEASRP